MSAAARAAANTAMDTALSNLTAQIPGWINNGGGRNNLVRNVLAALAASDPGIARAIHRRWGTSSLVGVKSTITAGDTAL